MQEEENSSKEVQPLQKIFPFDPLTTSYGMGWTEVQAVRYHTTPSREVTATGAPTTHVLALTIRPPASAGGVLPHRKLRTVVEYIM